MIRKPAPPSAQTAHLPIKLTNPFKDIHVHPRIKRFFWQGRILPAFWTVASLVSVTVNLILIVVLILLGRQLFALKPLVEQGLVGGLYNNFVLMDQAHIVTDITVNATIPIRFDLPVSTNTTVYLTKDIKIPNTWVALNTAGQGINLSINAPADITLPEGTPLDIQLTITVPVSTTVPVSLPVHVDIPLNQTELHQPFTGLQSVVAPYRAFLGSLPNAWEDTPVCTPKTDWMCQKLFDLKK
jgi:hypothetical protein